jgi:VWFA-related protein
MAIPLSCRRVGPLVSILLLCTTISHGASGDPPAYTYRTNVNEVRMTFAAMDQSNHGVATLQASDFAIVDKDIIVRNFQSFTRSDWTKLEIAIVVDASESVTPRFRREMADVLDLVSQAAGVPDENLSIFSFQASQPSLLCGGDCRATRAADRLPPRRAGGLTPLFDTLIFATNYLAEHGDAHAEKILILFSDGDDTISRASLSEAIDTSLKDEVQIFGIDLGNSRTYQGAAVLRGLAHATGGRYFPPPSSATEALNVILEGFRATYTVTYRLPRHSTGFHTVQILPTHNLKLQFHSRSGYYYPTRIQ